jgi:hypothetical protein
VVTSSPNAFWTATAKTSTPVMVVTLRMNRDFMPHMWLYYPETSKGQQDTTTTGTSEVPVVVVSCCTEGKVPYQCCKKDIRYFIKNMWYHIHFVNDVCYTHLSIHTSY